MRQHLRRPRIGRIALTLTGITMLGIPGTASANVYTDVSDFNLTESISTYSSYLATSSSGVQYRWVDSPSKPNYIQAANCANNSAYGQTYFGSGNTAYQWIGTVANGACFNLRGFTAGGWGPMSYYDGRLFR